MPIVTLTTDWNKNDFYLGSIKGKLVKLIKDVNIIDLSHDVAGFNLVQAAFVVRNSFRNFPKGTIHIIGVTTDAALDPKFLLVSCEDQYFLCADNGILGLLFENEEYTVYDIKFDKTSSPKTFSSFDVFTTITKKLAEGAPPGSLGEKTKDFQKQVPMREIIEDSVIVGSVLYIDSYKNAITNISREVFERVGQKRPFEIFVQSNYYKISKINESYQETAVGELLAVFNSINLLEIAIKNGNAAELLNLSYSSTVRVKFYNK